jgi:ABC-type amino acid transport substrate-binding protein
MNIRIAAVFTLIAAPHLAGAIQPEEPLESEPRTLRIATKIAEPFVTGGESAEGEQTDPSLLGGLSIDLWRRLAENLNLEYELTVTTLDDLLDGVAEGRFDAGVGAISVTPERERRMDMTHGYYMDGLGIAIPAGSGGLSWIRGFTNIFTLGFLSAVAALAFLLLIVGVLAWLAERRRNTEQFNAGPAKGIGDGFWFAAVTMTTVGYGDKAPSTFAGRLIALVWMFGSIIVISAFTGAIASSLTAAQITGDVRSPEDLRTARIGALADSATVTALRDRGVSARTYGAIDDGLAAVSAGEIDAFVHDHAILKYHVARDYPGQVRMLEAQFNMNAYAIVLPSGSPLLEDLNQQILEITRNPVWNDVLSRYIGN